MKNLLEFLLGKSSALPSKDQIISQWKNEEFLYVEPPKKWGQAPPSLDFLINVLRWCSDSEFFLRNQILNDYGYIQPYCVEGLFRLRKKVTERELELLSKKNIIVKDVDGDRGGRVIDLVTLALENNERVEQDSLEIAGTRSWGYFTESIEASNIQGLWLGMQFGLDIPLRLLNLSPAAYACSTEATKAFQFLIQYEVNPCHKTSTGESLFECVKKYGNKHDKKIFLRFFKRKMLKMHELE